MSLFAVKVDSVINNIGYQNTLKSFQSDFKNGIPIVVEVYFGNDTISANIKFIGVCKVFLSYRYPLLSRLFRLLVSTFPAVKDTSFLQYHICLCLQTFISLTFY